MIHMRVKKFISRFQFPLIRIYSFIRSKDILVESLRYIFFRKRCKITEIRGFRFGDRKSMVGTVRIGNFTVTGIGKSASFIAEYFQREWIVMSRSST